MASVLEIQNLQVSYRSREGILSSALAGVSFDLMPGEIIGVLGESGSGKSTLAVSLVRLLPRNGEIIRGAVHFEGQDLLRATPDELQQIRGRCISLIFQEPSLALHPALRAGEQVRQVLAAHSSPGKSALNERTRQVFAQLFPEDADRISRSYPHQLSGGQRQRVLIAQAIACGPSVVIADEPTASLDSATQMELLAVFRTLRERMGLAMIFITHTQPSSALWLCRPCASPLRRPGCRVWTGCNRARLAPASLHQGFVPVHSGDIRGAWERS
ncbi:MAG: hypothetical protein DMG56_24085 [Acidobacteria bacterium]|nr:MAG: hypothetical protein DMG56_24085 [Acidobacteriota bacterium]